MLSRADDNGVYLVHLKDLKLFIWINKVINSSEGDWSLLNTICLLDMCADLRVLDVTVEDEHTSVVCLNAVADNAKFVSSTWMNVYSIWMLGQGHCIRYRS